MRTATRALALAASLATTAMLGCNGQQGAAGPQGPAGADGQNAVTTGSIAGTVKDASGAAVAGVAIATVPDSGGATSGSDGKFVLSGVPIGAYAVTAAKPGFAVFTLAGVGVRAGGTTNVNLVLTVDATSTGSVSGKVTDATASAGPLGGVVVTVEGQSLQATTAADGTFTITGVPPGPVYLAATAPGAAYLDTELRAAVLVRPGQATSGVQLALSARPPDGATYVGMDTIGGCATCHAANVAAERGSTHFRSLTRIARDGSGKATAGAFARMLNATLTTPRVVMVPLAGTIAAATSGAVVTGTGTTFLTDVQKGDELGYTPTGLGWTKIGVVSSVDSDGQVTLAANATLAPGAASITTVKYGVKRTSKLYTHMLPEDAGDIVAPAWPGVKATNPNYDANDPCIYADPPSGVSCAAGGTKKYADGQVNVYVCNLKDGVNYLNDEFVQKFGGNAYTCTDGKFYDGMTAPAVPLVHVDVIYGGQGDKDGSGAAHLNMGVFKQRFQGRLSDVRAADGWSYTAGKNLDSLTLPIQVLESGDRTNGGYKMNGYHPTEQKFPGESWTQRTRTFSHACAGCHNTGLSIQWQMETVTLPFGRDGAPNNSPFTYAAITSYGFLDENLTCEHCHGPGSEHVRQGGGRGVAIINPKRLTAEAERQLCAKCHGYDDATNADPVQDYGFEFPWNASHAGALGGGDFVPGVYDVGTFFDNWGERQSDDEGFWDPVANGGKLYGQAHRQQYTMLAQSKHVNNAYLKATCTSCHDGHTQYLGTTSVESAASDVYAFAGADYRNDVLCLSCHAGGGPLAIMPSAGPWASITKDDVANVHVGAGGSATKNGAAIAATAEEVYASKLAIGNAVGQHMYQKAGMVAFYDPTNEAKPVGRCTSCHMPKVAKSGGYVTGTDANGDKALVEGDQASHVFDVVWPWESNAVSRGGPTFQSGYYGQMVSATNVKYDLFGYMPNSCSKCHATSRRASLVCPDTSALWPSFWPFGEHRDDPYWAGCYRSTTAP